ncbi:MAG: acyl-CoA dehydrogenase family protein, partial [Deltaproteobacteria bacterium]|nr:acyl-CoA dehydrogenase family protein [Deltaproteobacteria bacterium]
MSFQLTQEQEMIRLMAQDFAKTELEPFASNWDQEARFPEEAVRKMGALGLMGMMIPAEYGGAGAGALSYSLALQEIAYACASTAVTMSVTNLCSDPILQFGTEEQKHRYLVPLARGEMLGAFAVTEPAAGSDPGSMTTRAEDCGDHYRVNGAKVFITNGSRADVIVLIARTGSEKANRGLSAFLLTKGTPGFRIGRAEEKMGLRASDTVELIFEDCRIPKENLLGREGIGFKIAMAALDSGRIGIASQS